MALVTQATSTAVARPQWGIINKASCEVAKEMFRGYSIQKIEIVFKGKAETFTDDAGRYEYTYFTNTKSTEFFTKCGPEKIFDFAQSVRDSYLKMIEGFRKNRDLLQLDCEVTIISAKKTDKITASLAFNGLQGRLAAPFWDRVIGTIGSSDIVNALTDADLPTESEDSGHLLWLRALDLA